MWLNIVEIASIFGMLFPGMPTLVNTVRGCAVPAVNYFLLAVAATTFIACRFYLR